MDFVLFVISLLGSVASALFTFYFWMVRVRNERPNVRLFLSGCNFELSTRRGDERYVSFKIEIIAANYSVLPNAILKAHLRWKSREGNWEARPIHPVTMPINLSPSQTALVPFTGMLKLGNSEAVEKGDERADIIRSQLVYWFGNPLQLQVELQTLQEEPLTVELTAKDWTAG